ncbi:TRAFAC clade GTPase domain-containing protein [Janthinobacterium lividum]|uniref:TRAFAC clade GTPase domain-containing protein n=1 Tax=Janthinobacterium lividum TaxID=29581 RepID=UPI000A4EDB13|nr:hypothetical protein [Janthinobacterium lividum]
MTEQSVVVMGLPGSGKTTYLAALWHIVSAKDLPTKLIFSHLGSGNHKHLNEIAARWREAKQQERTLLQGLKMVSMNLRNSDADGLTVTFPDVPGEEYRRMWEEREIEPGVLDTLKAPNVLFFIHSDSIVIPTWVADEVDMYKKLGIPLPTDLGQPIPWHPRTAPTQVQVVDILQLLRAAPIDVGPRKLAIILSVWDKAQGERLSPSRYLEQKMPLLHQYLSCNADEWKLRVYGVSAQGGEYDSVEPGAPKSAEADELRKKRRPSTRVDVVMDEQHSHDLTEPLAWLME